MSPDAQRPTGVSVSRRTSESWELARDDFASVFQTDEVRRRRAKCASSSTRLAAGWRSDTATNTTPEPEQVGKRIEALAVEARQLRRRPWKSWSERAENAEARDEATSRLEGLADEARGLENKRLLTPRRPSR